MLSSVLLIVGAAIAVATAADVETLTGASNTFAKDLYMQLTKHNDGQNIVFAPLALSLAMAMVYNGAEDRTERQVQRNMYFDLVTDSKEELNTLNNEVMQVFKKPTNQYTLRLANKLFGRRDYTYERDFQRVMSRTYSAPLEKLDLEANVDYAIEHVNDWVAERTNMKVADMLHDGDLTANTSLALISAYYFRGIWEESFPEDDTEDRPFFRGERDSVDVKMMYTEANFSYKAMSDFKSNVLEIPYSGGTVSMYIVLPWNKTHGLEELEACIKKSTSLEAIFEGLRMTPVKVVLPLFSLEKTLDLVGNLTKLGVDDIFSEKFAQLGEITSDSGVHVSTALHKTLFGIDEQGKLPREAFNRTTNSSHGPEPMVLANRPFMFFVRESTTGAILHMGRMVDPSAGAPQSVVVSLGLVLLALIMSFA